MLIEEREVQSRKARSPIVASPSGRIIEVREEREVQPEKVAASIVVSPSGRMMEEREVQP